MNNIISYCSCSNSAAVATALQMKCFLIVPKINQYINWLTGRDLPIGNALVAGGRPAASHIFFKLLKYGVIRVFSGFSPKMRIVL